MRLIGGGDPLEAVGAALAGDGGARLDQRAADPAAAGRLGSTKRSFISTISAGASEVKVQ